MERWGVRTLCVLLLSGLCCGAGAQTSQSAECTVDQPAFSTSAPNIFNDRQEQDLGDALAELFEPEMRLAPPAQDDQLTRIGERLLATLPPTGVHYRFRIYDSGEVNGFSLAGGRVYISRKLIAAVKNEDELAGVIAHEIGHISTHQTAIELSRIFRIRLGVTQVTDRADIFAKVHQLWSTPAKPHESEEKEEKGELAADRVALYAMVRAGYAAESFPSFFNQVSLNKGKTGNWFSDLVGITHEASQRYRAALNLVGALPGGCKGRQTASGAAFQAWQKFTVEERVKSVAEGATGDRPLQLDPPLRPSLWRISFSPDGHYLLGQDEGSITVADKEAGKVLFRIEAPDAEEAQFTPDSKEVVFHDAKLRVERWSVASGQRTAVKELVVMDGCEQTLLSQDGKALVCVNLSEHNGTVRVGLRLIDVETGTYFFEKPNFYEPGPYSLMYFSFMRMLRNTLNGYNLVNISASPGGRYLLISLERQLLAFDMEKREQIKLGGKLKDLGQVLMSFIGENELFVEGELKGNGFHQGRLLSFPDGRLIKESDIGNQQVAEVTKGEFLRIWPLKDYAVGLIDESQGKLVAASKFTALDAWDKSVAMEGAMGGLELIQVGTAETKRIPLPLGPLPGLRAAVFSPDGKYLAISMKNRARIWNLETGKQLGQIRPFQSAWMDGADQLFGQFTKFVDWEPKEMRLSMEPLAAKELAKLDDEEWQYHNFELRYKPLGKDKSMNHNITFEVKKMETQTVAWSRDYPHERPACWPAEDDRLVLGWDLGVETAKAEIKNYPKLQAQADALVNKKKGLLIEIVAPETGAPLQQVVVPEADLTGGWGDVRRAMVSGDFVLTRGEHGNTVIYRIADGTKVGEFFGSPVATDAGAKLIAAVNREDEILLVDMQTGKERKRFTLGSPVRAARIVKGKEKNLLVLTADQVVHRLALND